MNHLGHHPSHDANDQGHNNNQSRHERASTTRASTTRASTTRATRAITSHAAEGWPSGSLAPTRTWWGPAHRRDVSAPRHNPGPSHPLKRTGPAPPRGSPAAAGGPATGDLASFLARRTARVIRPHGPRTRATYRSRCDEPNPLRPDKRAGTDVPPAPAHARPTVRPPSVERERCSLFRRCG